MNRLVAYWRALWRLCPQCNSDAPAMDRCPVCKGWRWTDGQSEGPQPPPDSLVATWLARYFEAGESDLDYATRLAMVMARDFYPDVQFVPLEDLYGVLTQIDNMMTGLGSRTQGKEPQP